MEYGADISKIDPVRCLGTLLGLTGKNLFAIFEWGVNYAYKFLPATFNQPTTSHEHFQFLQRTCNKSIASGNEHERFQRS